MIVSDNPEAATRYFPAWRETIPLAARKAPETLNP
jgi:hypothetical protein